MRRSSSRRCAAASAWPTAERTAPAAPASRRDSKAGGQQGPHSSSALSAEEQAQRKLLVCCSRPDSDLVIEARELSGFGDIPIRKMPCRIPSIERAATDVAIVTLQLPAAERLQFRAGQYLEFILRDG